MKKQLDPEDHVAELYLELAQKLMREYGITPEQIARIAVGLAVHMYMEYHRDGAQAGVVHLRESADALEKLCGPKPASSVN